MSRQIKDIKDKHTGNLVYPRTHIKAVVVDENTNLEQLVGENLPLRLSTLETTVDNKVDKVTGMGLSTNDFTTALKNKLSGLTNYDDTTIKQSITKIQTLIDTLVNTNASAAIDTFNEIVAFLEGIENSSDLDSIIAAIELQIALRYTKPADGIPASDLSNSVLSALNKANTALQSYTEKYTGTITGIKMNGASKGTSGVIDLGTVIIAHQDISGKADKSSLAAVATSGSYNDLSNKPTIPSAVTESTVDGWGFTKNTGTYSKPSTGIPKSDLVTEVLTSLNNADYYIGNNNVTSIASVPVDKRLVIATISSSQSLSLVSNLSAGKEVHIIIYNSRSSSISIALPNTGNYKCLVDTALSIDAKNYAEINIISDGTNMYIRAI